MTGRCKLMIEGGESEFYSLKYDDFQREREKNAPKYLIDKGK